MTNNHDFAVAVCENKIYCINGGLTSSLNETTGIWTDVPGEGFTWVYDPAIDTWENKTAMPISRGNLQANVVDEKIYVMGSEYVYSSDIRGYVGYFILQVYDPVEDCWGLGSSMPEGFYGYSTVYLDKIYVVGTHAEPYWNNVGNLAYKATPMIQSYDPKKDVWTIAITEGPRIHAGAFSVSTLGVYAPAKLYCFYNALGAPNAQIFNCQVFDFETQSWDNYDVGPVVCEHFAVAVLDDMVYVVGGNTVSFDAPHGAPQFPIVTNLALTKRYVPFGYGRVAPVVSVLSLESMGEYGSRGVPLVFNLNRPVVWMGYSLDGQATVRVGGNVSLSGLSGGVHNVTVFAEDEYGNVGDSETITFVVVSETLFPISTVAMVVVGVVVIVCTVLFLIFRLRKNKHQKEPNHIVSIVNNDGFA
ncbi:MAG: hypothetical protein LBQ98_06550 [Nitrososphaerota archaeon]|nr:hypothetical protein [Nitrososphaerota archaeon]